MSGLTPKATNHAGLAPLASRFVDVGGVGRRFAHEGEIQLTYRSQCCFPSAVGAESPDARVLVRRERGIQAGGADQFDEIRLRVGVL